MIKDMINTKLIEKADHHCDWVSSTKFVMKSSGKLCLTIDYSGVNKSILRQAHHFPSQQELLKRIDAQDSKFIAKLDMKDSYHQVRLHED